MRLLAAARDDILLQAALLAFPVIGLEQVLHTSPAALAAEPLYQALHWLSDALLALPLAAAAVWSGHRVARRLGHASRSRPDAIMHGLAIAFIFALLLVPGAALHDQADRLTHVHAQLAIHSHTPAVPTTDGTLAYLVHALQDAFAGQLVGLPVIVLVLLATTQVTRAAARGVVTHSGST